MESSKKSDKVKPFKDNTKGKMESSRCALVIIYTLIGLFSWCIYFFVNHVNGNLHSVKTFVDLYIPFIPVFVIPYLLFFPYLMLTIIWRAIKTEKFGIVIATFTLINIISVLFYIHYQTYIIRPDLSQEKNVFVQLVNLIYSHDQPYNCFPSSHTSGAVFASLVHWRYQSRLRWVATAITILICCATVFIKQHNIADVAGGIILALGSMYVVETIADKMPPSIRTTLLM